jgi:hypothetical protein
MELKLISKQPSVVIDTSNKYFCLIFSLANLWINLENILESVYYPDVGLTNCVIISDCRDDRILVQYNCNPSLVTSMGGHTLPLPILDYNKPDFLEILDRINFVGALYLEKIDTNTVNLSVKITNLTDLSGLNVKSYKIKLDTYPTHLIRGLLLLNIIPLVLDKAVDFSDVNIQSLAGSDPIGLKIGEFVTKDMRYIVEWWTNLRSLAKGDFSPITFTYENFEVSVEYEYFDSEPLHIATLGNYYAKVRKTKVIVLTFQPVELGLNESVEYSFKIYYRKV